MKRFKFRLQAVLEQRTRIETQAKLSFGEAQQALVKAKQLLDELIDVRSAILNELGQRRISGDFCPDESRIYQEYLKTIANCIHDQEAYVRDLTTTAEAFRLNLVGASTNRQIVDKLKDKAHESHVHEATVAEQNMIDEMATVRHHYKKTVDAHAV
ncbi:MAG TPA: flagellar export protein FliJ [Capsulimonadaceae bacterium]|jgi:flagellar FliJ protein